jgi:hypothetical protein
MHTLTGTPPEERRVVEDAGTQAEIPNASLPPIETTAAAEAATQDEAPKLPLAAKYFDYPHHLYTNTAKGGTKIKIGMLLQDAPEEVHPLTGPKWDEKLKEPNR